MVFIQSSLQHKIILPRKPEGRKLHPTLILLHGRGADEYDLLSLAEVLDERLLVISVRAPYPFQYGGGYAWYEILEAGKPEPVMYEASYHHILKFTDDIKRGYPVQSEKIYLFGFSMGSMMSYTVALAHPELYAGVIAHSGYIPEDAKIPYRWNEIGRLKFFVAHGFNDPIVPVQLGRRSKNLLEDHGAALEYHEYPIGHEICQASISDISTWLTSRLNND